MSRGGFTILFGSPMGSLALFTLTRAPHFVDVASASALARAFAVTEPSKQSLMQVGCASRCSAPSTTGDTTMDEPIEHKYKEVLTGFEFGPTGSIDIDAGIMYGRCDAGSERVAIAIVSDEAVAVLLCIAWFEANTPPGHERRTVRTRRPVKPTALVRLPTL